MIHRPKYIQPKLSCNEWHDKVKDNLIIDAINFIMPYNTIYSNRMHGAILAWLLNKKTYLINNSYGKSLSLYDTWFSNDKNINMYI